MADSHYLLYIFSDDKYKILQHFKVEYHPKLHNLGSCQNVHYYSSYDKYKNYTQTRLLLKSDAAFRIQLRSG